MSFARTLRKPFQLLDQRFPKRIPPITGKPLRFLRLLWLAAFALAVVGPLGAVYLRLAEAPNNSELVLGSRAGIAVELDNATQIRFPVGTATERAGVARGDQLIRINDQRLAQSMPISRVTDTERALDPAYQALNKVLFGSDRDAVRLAFRTSSGEERTVTIRPGEQHFAEEIRRIGLAPRLISFIDIVHAIFYPLLLWIAFVLHVRNPNQPVPTLISFAVLLVIGTELPSVIFLMEIGVPRGLILALFDLSNMALVAAVLLFPDGRLTPRRVLIPLFLVPALLFLQGTLYQAVFFAIFFIAFTVFATRLKDATGATRQQLKFLFAGLAGYPLFRLLSISFDLVKWEVGSIGQMLFWEAAAGVTLALSIVALHFALFSALRRHRLYDAEELFSRSAMVAALSLIITGFFALTSTILQSTSESVLGQQAGPWPSLIAAAAAVLLIKPAQKRIHGWAERQFQRRLFELRTELPKRMDDLRETASPTHLLQDALSNIATALRSSGAAVIINGRTAACFRVSTKELREWLRSAQLDEQKDLHCHRADGLFPLRLPLRSGKMAQSVVGWILLGPRPDGSMYSRDERQALLDIEESIARAVEVARQRHQAAAADRRWKSRQEKRLQVLEDRIDQLANELAAAGSTRLGSNIDI